MSSILSPFLTSSSSEPAALEAVDQANPDLSESARERLKDALLAAAVPHWVDPAFLAALLEISVEVSKAMFLRLRGLGVIEPCLARGRDAIKVAETARQTFREHLRTEAPKRWRKLATLAREHVSKLPGPAARVEALYHLFAIDSEAAVAECESLDREVRLTEGLENERALARALTELAEAGWLTGAARVETLLCPLEERNSRGEIVSLEAARRVLALAEQAGHSSAMGRARALLGDIHKAGGKLDKALAQYRDCLTMLEWLAARDPGKAKRQRDLAVAHSKIGDVLRAQGKLHEALAAYRQDLLISQRLTQQDPDNPAWRRELAAAHARMGDVFQAQGKLDDALAAYGEELAMSQRLAARDPDNLEWRRELAVAHSKMGDIHEARGRWSEALAEYREDLVLSQRLARQDSENPVWQRDLALAHNKVGAALGALGRKEEGGEHHEKAVAEMERAMTLAPSNLAWRRDLENLRSWLE